MTEPTDAEIVAVMRDGYNCRYNDEQDHIDFARAVLAKWGAPVVAGEPVAWLDPWTGAKVTTDYDAYGKHGIPLYTAPKPPPPQPTQAQAGAVPLTTEQIKAMAREYPAEDLCGWSYRMGVADAEAHYGIKKGVIK